MKKWLRKAKMIFILALAAGVCLTGCSSQNDSEQSKEKVFSYDGTDVYLDEVWLYADITKAKYETQYGSTFGSSLWTMQVSTDEDGNAVTMEEMVKENVISQIKQIIVLNNKAEEMNISLSDEEKSKAKKSAKAFASDDEGKAILEETGADQDLIQKMYEENAIASKVREEVIKEVDTDVSDDEARMTTVYRLLFPKTTTDEESGESKEMTDKELKAQKKKANEAYKKLESGTSIEDLAQEYELDSTTDETFAKGESEEGSDFETAIYKLKDGEYTKVMDTDAGYVIAKLVALTDEEATEEKKSEIVTERQEEAYEEKYSEWTKDLEEDWDADEDINQDAFEQIVFAETSDSTESSEETSSEETSSEETSSEETSSGETATAETTDEETTATTAAETKTSTADTTAASQETTQASTAAE